MRRENGDTRPLLVSVDSEETKKKIFSRLYKLKETNQYLNISMSHDMTKDERTKTKLLVEEAKLKTNDDQDSKNWIFKVRGPPWDQRIQRVRRRLQH